MAASAWPESCTGKIIWAELPGLPKKMRWPVQVVDMPLVFCNADNAWLHLNRNSHVEEFHLRNIDKWKSAGKIALEKKPATCTAFLRDVEWAAHKHISYEISTKKASVGPEENASGSTSLLQEASDITLPEASDTALPEASDTALPEASDTTLPEASDTALPEASDTALPEASDTVLPEASDTALPEASDTALPEASDTALPETSDTVLPEASDTALPETSDITLPGASDITLPEASDVTLPEASDITLPEASDVTLPEASDITLPEASDTALPVASDITLPEASDTALPEALDTSLTEPSDTALLEASETALPEASDTALPEALDTSLPEASDTALPVATDVTLPEASDTTLPEASHTVLPEASGTTLPVASDISLPEESDTALPEALDITLPEASDTVLPEASNTVLPEASNTALPEASDTALLQEAPKILLIQKVPDIVLLHEASDITLPVASVITLCVASGNALVQEAPDIILPETSDTALPVASDTALPVASDTALPLASGTAIVQEAPDIILPKTTEITLPEASDTALPEEKASCSTFPEASDASLRVAPDNALSEALDTFLPEGEASDTTLSEGEALDTALSEALDTALPEGEGSDSDCTLETALSRKRKRPISDSDIVSNSESDSDISEQFPMLTAYSKRKLVDLDSDGSESDSSVEPENIIRDINNKDIYISAVTKCRLAKTGKRKVTDRVYDIAHPCPFCSKAVKNFSHHIFTKKHANEASIKEILKVEDDKERKKKIAKLRLKAAHEHNMKVLEEKKGEIYVLRRANSIEEDSDDEDLSPDEGSSRTMDISEYGACPNCYGWILLHSLKRHMNTCSSHNISSNRALIVQSHIIMGKIPEDASQALVKEVFPIMKNDDIAEIACNDSLIINLGNQWMMRHRGNEIMRKYYTSSVMRLAAKLKLAAQTLTNTNYEINHYLAPAYFENIIKAALVCCHAEDEEDLKAPSNAIKLGHDIKRMVNAKLAKAIIHEDASQQKEAQDFLKLMGMEWGLRVTKLARCTLVERSFNQVKELPLPEDVKRLSEHLQNEVGSVDCNDWSFSNFRKAAILALARLTLYNRRRCHEVQALRLSAYAARKVGASQIGQEIRGELTQFEQRLLTTQEHVIIRGKTGRGVPLIIPSDARGTLQFLADSDVRKKAGILKDNPYLFANNGAGVFRGYDAIREVVSSPEAGLLKPNLLRTSNMRKYMATMLQALNTTESERQWVLDHLGHTMDVHRIHYRQTSDMIERVDVAKILLIQDLGLVSKYRGKRLEDIQLDEMLQNIQPEEDDVVSSSELQSRTITNMTIEDGMDEYIPDMTDDDEEEEDEEEEEIRAKKRRPQKPKKPSLRQKWTRDEEKELKDLFKDHFKTLQLPGQKIIEKMMKVSFSKDGEIHKRKRDTIKKKLSNMMIKLRKK